MIINDESICVFGSVARSTQDSNSDKDVLVVSGSRLSSRKTISQWEKRGWSVAFYTWNRLTQMASKGSLFVQHLKQDGQHVKDRSGNLKSLLENYQPKKSYRAELAESKLLTRALERRCDSIWSAMFQCDVLYTFIRNAGILELASQGVYEFEYPRIIAKIGEIKGLSSHEVTALEHLRLQKAAYRERNFGVPDSLETAENVKGISQLHFEVDYRQLRSTADARIFDLPYATLRDIEARLLAYASPKSFDALPINSAIQQLWDWVVNPRNYSWNIRCINDAQMQAINRTISACMAMNSYEENSPISPSTIFAYPACPIADRHQLHLYRQHAPKPSL